MKKALVLSSGGVDSTTCLAQMVNELGAENVVTATFIYGQKHSKEVEAARKIAQYYGVQHRVFDITGLSLFDGSNCTLLEGNGEIAHSSYAEQVKESEKGVGTYVPFRNGLMLSMMASVALSMFPGEKDKILLCIGAHADDAAGNAYADCSQSFIKSINKAIFSGTYKRVKIYAPFVDKNKAEVVATGLKLKAPYELTWSCYEGRDEPCGKCGTCIDRANAFSINGAKDPAIIKGDEESEKN